MSNQITTQGENASVAGRIPHSSRERKQNLNTLLSMGNGQAFTNRSVMNLSCLQIRAQLANEDSREFGKLNPDID